MNPNDYDEDGNNIVPCPICMSNFNPCKDGGKCPDEDEFVRSVEAKQFIESQQELAKKIDDYYRENFDDSTARKNLYITELLSQYKDQIIQNIGEELMRRAEGEKRNAPPEMSLSLFDKEHNESIDTIKQHIINVTGVE